MRQSVPEWKYRRFFGPMRHYPPNIWGEKTTNRLPS